ncbi:VOC family protein [Roseibium aggregatum]|uniref:VOC family protein n=1 Tax=Roseibium aggregatum TaxID=187304 RepID=A0A939EB16_9HYPH|nr:VOC family protein [Roseibium aggregatum]MBN9669875.1 VOC family protein [Roseibium aggregatum]
MNPTLISELSLAAPKIHHVGIVMPDMESADHFMALFGHKEEYRGFVPEFECWCLFCHAPAGQAAVELVVPTGGSLSKFNKGAGGLHHYAIETENLVELQRQFATKDMPMLKPEPVKGAGNFICNFLSPVVTRGILIEFVELLDQPNS